MLFRSDRAGTNPSVRDVGCGGGRAAFALVPPAVRVIGVDHQQVMLDVFSDEAAARSVSCQTVLGDWPQVAEGTPSADVVTCHHVLYNVGDIVPFLAALDRHGRVRVVIEITQQHPLSTLSGLWKHFWGLERPSAPTCTDALEVIRSLGIDARMDRFETALAPEPVGDETVGSTRILLCLPAAREIGRAHV